MGRHRETYCSETANAGHAERTTERTRTMKFNSSARFNRKSFNSEKLFDAGIHDAGTVNNTLDALATPFATPYEDWTHRITHTISGAAAEQTDYPIKITIHRSHGANSGDDLYVENECEPDYKDIRFADSDGVTPLSYWIESYDPNTADIWVKIPVIPITPGDATFYIYWGNAAATDESDGASTFTHYSDCSDLTGHTYSNTSVDSGAFKTDNLNSGNWYKTGATIANGYAIRLRQKQTPSPSSVVGTYFGFPFGSGSVTLFFYYATGGELKAYNKGASGVILPAIDTDYHVFEIQRGGAPRFCVDNTDYGEVGTSNTNALSFGAKYGWASWTNYGYTDWYVVRPFIYPEPAHSTWGTEEEIDIVRSHTLEFQFIPTTTIENSPALTTELQMANITAAIENSPEVWSSVFIDTTPVFSVPFDGGSSEIIVGETVTGNTSGATGTVTLVVVTGGTWGEGTAEGYILIDTASGVFENNEEIDGSTSGNDAAEVDGDITRITPKVIEKSCWKSIDEVYWQASVLLDGLYAFSDVAGFKELYIDMPDHTATSQRVFYGFIPNQGIVQNPGDNTTRLTAYSHAYNLANQFIPDAYRDTVEWVPSGATGYVTFSDPSVPITAFLGGSLWNLTTGIQPQNILTITDWGTSDIPIRGFAWGPEVNKWQAIQEMADYCGYVFEVQYDSSQDCAVANFCAVDDIDTYLGVPAAVTFDKGDASKYVLNVSKERRGTEMINRVRVQGRRNKRILNFVEGVTEFTAGHTVVDGLTGAEATIISCTKTAGAWGGTAIGYLIISYDRTGDFVHDSTIIDALGAGFGQATMQGNSVIYETYDEYTHSVESPAVTNLEERARERFFQLEEEYDSTPLIEAKCLAYYDMYALDPTPYSVTFRDRCDLRLWQKVKLTSFTEIPEDWMRIVSIRYTQRSGGAVDVSCTLNNADYVIAQRKMRRSLKNNDVTEIEKIVKAILAKKEVKVGEALKVQGEGITIELQDGERVVVGRSPE